MPDRIIKIMLIDDHVILRDGLRLMLANDPEFEIVGEAGDGEAAVRMASILSPDVIVMDRYLQGIDGIAATRQIHDAHPEIRIIGLTAAVNPYVAADWIRAGASGYVLKVAAFDELKTAIRTAASGKVYLNDAVLGEIVEASSSPAKGGRSPLSARELEVLKLVVEGRSTKQAARDLNLSVKTIESHRRNLMEKLQLDNVADLTRYALREGITAL